MTTYKTFAVAGGLGGGTPGSANIGNLIVRNLVTYPDVRVKVLARASSVGSSSAKELQALGVQVVPVDYSDRTSLVTALKDVQVVVSALTTTALDVQAALVDAVAATRNAPSSGNDGVQLFVPSEYGNDTTQVNEDSPLFPKRRVQLLLQDKGIPYTLFFTGPFADWVGHFTGPDDKGTITIVGSGNERVSFTAIADAARFIAHALTSESSVYVLQQGVSLPPSPPARARVAQPPSELQNAQYRIQGSSATFNDLAGLYKARTTTRSVEIVHEAPEDALKRFRENGDFVAFLKAEWARGRGFLGEPLSNPLWSEWKPRDVREFIE
ncbi:hypothetical protein QFC19_000429 [Naganishia cerealis]|uniref:Uncharacterized protein n=1 Tax=Naganishia cerealis TaxID=610337 RepID=A0ACC2WP04_9TREE|nr:hypothetical protein QFC19_000429 [Naganishia cerealis]